MPTSISVEKSDTGMARTAITIPTRRDHMGRGQQRKGRGGEREAAREAADFLLRTRVHGIYEAHDISIEGEPFEVKRCEKLSIKRAYDALNAGARGMIARLNREPWVIVLGYRDWLADQMELHTLREEKETRRSVA